MSGWMEKNADAFIKSYAGKTGAYTPAVFNVMPASIDTSGTSRVQTAIDEANAAHKLPGSSTFDSGTKPKASLGSTVVKDGANVISHVMDALSVGNFWSAHTAENFRQAANELTGLKDDGTKGEKNIGKGILDYLLAPGKAIGQGVENATGHGDKTTYSKVISNFETQGGIDPADHKKLNAALGFVGDVGLDPTTYVGLGILPAVKAIGKAGEKAVADAVEKGVHETAESAIEAGVGKKRMQVGKLADVGKNLSTKIKARGKVVQPGGGFQRTVEEPEVSDGRSIFDSIPVDDTAGKEIHNLVNATVPTGATITVPPVAHFGRQTMKDVTDTFSRIKTRTQLVNDSSLTPDELDSWVQAAGQVNEGINSVDDLGKIRQKDFAKTKTAAAAIHTAKVNHTSDELINKLVTPTLADDASKVAEGELKADPASAATVGRVTTDLHPDVQPAAERAYREAIETNITKPMESGKADIPGRDNENLYNRGDKSTKTHLGSNNIQDQATAAAKIFSKVTAAARKVPGQDNNFVVSQGLAALRNYDTEMMRRGFYPHLGDKTNSGIPISLSDIFTGMLQSDKGDWVAKYGINNWNDQLDNRTLMRAVDAGLRADSRNPAAQSLAIRDVLEREKGNSNAFTGKLTKEPKETFNAQARLDESVSAIHQSLPAIQEIQRNNEKFAMVNEASTVAAASAQTVSRFNDAVKTFNQGAAASALLDAPRDIRAAAKDVSGGIKAADDSVVDNALKTLPDKLDVTPDEAINVSRQGRVAKATARAEAGERLSRKLKRQIKGKGKLPPTVKEIPDNTTRPVPKELREEVNKSANDVFREDRIREVETEATTANEVIDVSQAHLLSVAGRTQSGLMKFMGMFRANGWMTGAEAGIMRKNIDFQRSMHVMLRSQLNTLWNKAPDRNFWRENFEHLRLGNGPIDPDFEKLANYVLDDSENSVMASMGVTKNQYDKFLDKSGVKDTYRPTTQEAGDWKLLDYSDKDFDPLDHLDRVFHAQNQAAVYAESAHDFSSLFGVSKWAPGFYKADFDAAKSANTQLLGSFIDTSKFYTRSTIESFHEFGKIMDGMENIMNYGGASSFVNGVLKPVASTWKMWNTIVRPGHHIKNQLGDMILSFQAGVTNPAAYKDGTRIMMTHDDTFKGIDGLQNLRNDWLNGVDLSQGKGLKRTYGNLKISDELVYRLAKNERLLNDYHLSEDLVYGSDRSITKASLKPRGPVGKVASKIEHGGGKISEIRDHHVRLSHFTDALKRASKSNPKATIEEAAAIAGHEVRRWHPDGSTLSVFEQKYAKLGVMFYSWQRAVLPLMLEGMLTHPGRAMVAPKALYAFAQSNGINLDNGFGSPFPTDGPDYPSYLTEGPYGPIVSAGGNEYSASPGIPLLDTLNDVGSLPRLGQTAVGSGNPLIKDPLELIVGHKLDTGAPIKDTSEYLDQQIPLGSYLDNITGRSLSTGFSQPLSNPDKATVTGGEAGRNALNFLLGMGLQNVGKDPNAR